MTFTQLLTNYQSKKSMGTWFRQRRSGKLKALIIECYKRNGHVNIIDIGGRPSYWNIFPEFFFTQYKINIVLANYGDEIPEKKLASHFSKIEIDACDLSIFKDNTFHLAHSNSVIEHVGSWKRMQQFARETQRVAESYYLQTPNFGFPIEPHYMMPFFHWLPEQIRAIILQKTRLGHIGKEPNIIHAMAVIQSIQLLNKAMIKGLFPNLTIDKEVFLGICKSHIVINK